MRNRIWLVVGASLGLLSVVLIRGYIHQLESKMRAEFLAARGESTDVVVATADIPEQRLVERGMVTTKTILADALQPHALVDPDEVVGKITLVPIYAGEQMRDSVLGARERAHTLSMKTPPGKRAVTVGVDSFSGSGGFIRPGDFVDVMGIFSFPGPDGTQTPVTVTLLQRVPVLAVGSSFSESPSGGETAGEAGTVTLALSPQETQLILSARTQGTLQLVLRPKADSVIVADLPIMTPDVLVAAILGAKAPPKQPPQPPRTAERRVEVYRGLEKEIVVLPDIALDENR